MKKLIFGVVAFFCLSISHAQEYKVVSFEGKTKSEIHQALLAWVANTFNSAKEVIQLNTADKIVVKGLVNGDYLVYTKWINQITKINIHFTVDLEIKDDKFRYAIYNKKAELLDHNMTFTYDEYVNNISMMPTTAEQFKGVAKSTQLAVHKSATASIEKVNREFKDLEKSIESIPSAHAKSEDW